MNKSNERSLTKLNCRTISGAAVTATLLTFGQMPSGYHATEKNGRSKGGDHSLVSLENLAREQESVNANVKQESFDLKSKLEDVIGGNNTDRIRSSEESGVIERGEKGLSRLEFRMGRLERINNAMFEDNVLAYSRGVQREFIRVNAEKRQRLDSLFGAEQGEFEFNRLLLLNIINFASTTELSSNDQEVIKIFKEALTQKVSALSGASPEERVLVNSAGRKHFESICDVTPKVTQGIMANRYILKAVLELAIDLGNAEIVEFNISNFKRDYKNDFKDLPPGEVLKCINDVTDLRISTWLQTNVVCRFSEPSLSTLPPEVINSICPSFQPSFTEQIEKCVREETERIERERSENSSGSSGSSREGHSSYH